MPDQRCGGNAAAEPLLLGGWRRHCSGRAAAGRLFSGLPERPQRTKRCRCWTVTIPRDTPFAVECRNTFNYFHFVTESLCQLCLIEEAGLEGPVYLHYPNNDEKTRPFARNFIAALFPELADRVVFQRAPFHHSRVVTPYNFANSFYQMPAAEVGLIDLYAPSNVYWKGRYATRASQGVLAMNSVDSSLLKLRARALQGDRGQGFQPFAAAVLGGSRS